MEYEAIFEIDGGISSGFGLKEPNYYQRNEKIYADSDEKAFKNALDLAIKHAKYGLSNPETNYITIKLLTLKDENNNILNQESLNKDSKINFEECCAIVKCSMLEHILFYDDM